MVGGGVDAHMGLRRLACQRHCRMPALALHCAPRSPPPPHTTAHPHPHPGMKLASLSKILKCAGNDDVITMKSEDSGDTITFMFESASEWLGGLCACVGGLGGGGAPPRAQRSHHAAHPPPRASHPPHTHPPLPLQTRSACLSLISSSWTLTRSTWASQVGAG